MVWLSPRDYERQEYVELRLNAPKGEKNYWRLIPLKSLIRLIGIRCGKNGTVMEVF